MIKTFWSIGTGKDFGLDADRAAVLNIKFDGRNESSVTAYFSVNFSSGFIQFECGVLADQSYNNEYTNWDGDINLQELHSQLNQLGVPRINKDAYEWVVYGRPETEKKD